jgi:hypothetical protein
VSSWTRAFVIGATLLGGLLAGMALDKAVVQLPTWRELGAQSWREFIRRADLGRGLVLYPLQGIAALLCSVLAAVTYRLDRFSPHAAAVPLYSAAALAIAALIVTARFMAPEILSLRGTVLDPVALSGVLASTQKWWILKTALHMLTFFANVWALVVLRT